MAIKLEYDASTFADALRPAFGEVIQEESKANISLDPDGTNPAEEWDDFLVPVIFGSDQKLVNARWSPHMFPNGVGAYDKCPVLCKIQTNELYITRFDPKLYPAWADSLASGNVAPPMPKTQTDWIEDEAVTKAKIFFTTQADSATAVLSERVTIDQDSGELTSVKDGVGDSVHPTTGDDRNDGYRLFSRWQVSGIGYPLFYQLMQDTVGSADWYAVNPRHTTTTTDPTTGDDRDNGYIALRSRWLNTSSGDLFMCSTDTAGAATWELINATGGGSGTVTSVGLSTDTGYLTVASSPVTSSGTVTLNKTTGQTAARVVSTPATTTGTAELRELGKEHISTALASPPTIGGTAPAPGTFTVLSATTNLNATAVSTPGSPSNGDIWHDSTQTALGVRLVGMNHWNGGVFFTQTADGSAAASGSDTDLAGTGVGSLTIKANRWVAGSTIEWEMYGRLNTDNTTNSRSLVITIKYGTVELVNQAVAFTNNYSTGNEANGRSWNARGRIKVRTGGATGTAVAEIWMQIDGLTARTTSGLLVSSIDFTADTVLHFYGKWTSYASGDTATVKDLVVNQLM